MQGIGDLGPSKRELAPACIFVLFGATGDLAARKIAPALYNLAGEGLVSGNFVVLGVARSPRSDEQFRQEMEEALAQYSRTPLDKALWARLSQRWFYFASEAHDAGSYTRLAARLRELDERFRTGGNCLFYLASTPDTFADVLDNLAAAGLDEPLREGGQSRVVIEKPFGYDLASAHALSTVALKHFREEQLYRIDHYLGKETVQNILALRFANVLFEPILNRRYVDHVQISVVEEVGMEGRRGPYYESVGALRDMVQNHMLQLLALAAMDVPLHIRAEDIRNEKVKILRAIKPLTPEEVARCTVRGQYTGSTGFQPVHGQGRLDRLEACPTNSLQTHPTEVLGYRQEHGVAADSQVETFVALRLELDMWRWAGVPFYLRTGKRLAEKHSLITIVFKQEPISLFSELGCDLRGRNRLTIRIHPDEGVTLLIDGKLPGPDMILRPIRLNFDYKTGFEWASPEAYEHLLLDVMLSQAMLFIRADEVEASWRVIDSIRNAWTVQGKPALIEYRPLSWGPEQAQSLFDDPYQQWYGA